jgi:hypothetical protein
MKILFIVLLVAAIGAGAYFYFSGKQKTSTSNSKELIVGKWKVDSVVENKGSDSSNRFAGLIHFIDSSIKNYEFDFRSDSLVFQTNNGQIKDTSFYELTNNKTILLWDKKDTSREKWMIDKLDTSNFVILDADSARFFLKRMK